MPRLITALITAATLAAGAAVPASPGASPATPPGGPFNDSCAFALSVAVPSVTPGSTIGAGLDPEAGPACGTTITTGGVWYRVAGTGSTITATTCPSNPVQPGDADFNTKLSVFCGSCAALNCVGGNDNGCGFFFQSTVSWCSEAGVTYLILVHGGNEQGDFDLSVFDDGVACADPPDCAPPTLGACCFPDEPCLDAAEGSCGNAGGTFMGAGTLCADVDCLDLVPENDVCTGAVPVAVPSLTEGSTVFAMQGDFGPCPPFTLSPGVWYTVTGTGNLLTATTCAGDPVQPGAASFDTIIKVFCGDCNASSCCHANQSGGCDDGKCEEAVCEIDPYCCEIQWDAICADEASFICPGLCAPFFCVTSNDDACDAGFLQSTASWCTEAGRTYYIQVLGFDDTGDFTLSVYDDGQPCEHPPICEACVFECAPGSTEEYEPNCGIPEDTTNGGCNSPIGFQSNCCIPGTQIGCNDLICYTTVCGIDPFCCDNPWDEFCAQLAIENCAGCANLVYPMLPISCGQTYCSTAGATFSNRDVDWYKLQLEEDSVVEVTATCGFAAIFGIVDNAGIDACAGLEDFVSSAFTLPCEPTTVPAFLTAGTWFLIIAPASFTPLPCPTEYEFSVACTHPGACCFGGGACFQRDVAECDAEGGIYLGPGADCYVTEGDTLSETSMPYADIPDGSPNGVYDTIVLDEQAAVGKVTADVTIDHTWIYDVVVTLTHDGATSVLWRNSCEGAQGLDATFDDAGEEVLCGYPTGGVIAPLEANGTPLRVFQGLDAAGSWTLHVRDRELPDAGKLIRWTLNVETGGEPAPCEEPAGRCCPPCPADCGNPDGVVDMMDLTALLEQWGASGPCAASDEPIGFRDLMALLAAWGPCPTCSVTTRGACDQVGGAWLQGADCSQPCTN